jgi:hypothetical protein
MGQVDGRWEAAVPGWPEDKWIDFFACRSLDSLLIIQEHRRHFLPYRITLCPDTAKRRGGVVLAMNGMVRITILLRETKFMQYGQG